jgi:hypothetical protein
MFSARGVALNVITASEQLRVLHNSVYLSAGLKLRGTNSTHTSVGENQVQLSRLLLRVFAKCAKYRPPGANQLLTPEVWVTPAFILTYAKGQRRKKKARCDLTSIFSYESWRGNRTDTAVGHCDQTANLMKWKFGYGWQSQTITYQTVITESGIYQWV